jgi:adenosylcobinamide-phosphate synthase
VRADAAHHPSPNAGVAEAAFAAALGLRLGGGENRYGDVVDARPPLGDGRPPAGRDIAAAVALSRDVTWILAAALAAAGAATLVTARAGVAIPRRPGSDRGDDARG